MRGKIRAFALFIVLLHSGCIWATTGDTAQQDIAREFSGAPTTNNNGANPIAAPTDCNAVLQQEEAAGQIPANASCYCQVGATTPTCVQNAASTCQSILPAEESRLGPNAKYYDCTCPTGASTPSCPSYYSLCQDNLQYYQNTTNQCSCANPSTTAVPTCVSDYSACEKNAAQYENSNTTCSCSQTSTAPNCCTSTTTQQCSTTQQCHTVTNCTGLSIVDGNGGWGYCQAPGGNWYLGGGEWWGGPCPAGDNMLDCPSEYLGPNQINISPGWCYEFSWPGNASATLNDGAVGWCSGGNHSACGYAAVAQNTCSTYQSCSPVTTCTPVTTQSCVTEP